MGTCFSLFLGVILSVFLILNTSELRAQAVDTAAVSTTEVAPQQSTQRKFNLTILDDSSFYGPAVNNINSSSTADNAIDAVTGLSSRHNVFFIYAINDKLSLKPILDFNYQFTDPTSGGASRGFTWNDNIVRLDYSGLAGTTIKSTTVGLDADIRYYLPTSKVAREANTIGALRLSLKPSLQFGHSNFSLTTTNYYKYWIQTQDLNAAGTGPLKRMELYSAPQLNYQVSSKINAFVLYEAVVAFDTLGKPSTTNAAISLTDLEPGMNFTITKQITLSPFLNWYTNQSIKTTSVNIGATVQLL